MYIHLQSNILKGQAGVAGSHVIENLIWSFSASVPFTQNTVSPTAAVNVETVTLSVKKRGKHV